MLLGRDRRRISVAIQLAIAVLALSTFACGDDIFSLKWAMDDERYALQYNAPYSCDPMTRRIQMIQEAIDARFQSNNYGVYVGGGGAALRAVGGQGDVGVFAMPTAWSTVRAGVIGMEYNGRGYGGATIDMRIHAATRFTPYFGLGGVVGFSSISHGERINYNSSGEKIQLARTLNPIGIAALIPELGVSYWLTSRARLNVGASWYAIDGRQREFLQVGASMEFSLRDPKLPVIPPPIPPYEEDDRDPYFMSYDPDLPDPDLSGDSATDGQLVECPSNASDKQLGVQTDNNLPAPRLPIPEILTSQSLFEQEPSVPVQGTAADSSGALTTPPVTTAPGDSHMDESGWPWLQSRRPSANP